MATRKLGQVSLVYPIPIVLVGAEVNGRPNFATVGDCAVMGLNPALVTVSLAATHFTTEGIVSNRAFSINFPATRMIDRVDYCGMVSGRDVDKTSLFEVVRGETGVPIAAECPVSLECSLVEETRIEHRVVFLAKVTQAHIDEALVRVVDGRVQLPEMSALDPIIYALDNRYDGIGTPIGTGYQEGKDLMEADSGSAPT